jgi:hypothetical protein
MTDSNEVALIVSAVAASLASIIYSFKHVKKSNCCGNTCEQAIPDMPQVIRQRSRSQAVVMTPIPETTATQPEPQRELTQPSIWDYIRPKPRQNDTISTEV